MCVCVCMYVCMCVCMYVCVSYAVLHIQFHFASLGGFTQACVLAGMSKNVYQVNCTKYSIYAILHRSNLSFT